MMRASDYVMGHEMEINGEALALQELKDDAFDDVRAWLEDLDEYTLYWLLHEINDEFYQMDDLNDVYDCLTPKEIINDIAVWIDTSDEYFNASTERSGDDPWSVSGLQIDRVAEGILNGKYTCNDEELESILDEYNELRIAINQKFRYYRQAKTLFDMAMETNPEETITILWNMNN